MNKKATQTTIDIDAIGKKLSVRVLLVCMAFLIVNIIGGGLSSVKLDLTDGKLYSLSPVTKEIITDLENDIAITFYVSDELLKFAPNYIPFAERLTVLLEQMDVISDSITFEYVGVEAFSENEDKALSAGVSAVPLNSDGDRVYFGLHLRAGTNEQTKNQAIPFLQLERENFLEYDIVKILTELNYQTFPKIAVLSDADPLGFGFAARQQATQSWAVMQQIQEFYQLEQVFEPQDIFKIAPNMLLIAHGANLDDPMLWAIEQYLMRGGRALIYADPFFESFSLTAGPDANLNSTKPLNRIFAQWGINITDDKVVADPEFGIPVNLSRNNDVVPIIHSAWLRYNRAHMSGTDLITSDIDMLNIISAGEIQIKEPGKVQIDALIESSENSQLVDGAKILGATPDLEGVLRDFNPNNGKKRLLAARVIGSFESIFPNGRPTYDEVTEEEAAFPWPKSLKQSEKPFEVVLVSDVDMLQDRFWVQVNQIAGQNLLLPFSGNGAMLENAVENLSGLPALGQLRSRGTRLRPFVLLDDIRQYAEQNYRVRANELSRKSQELQTHIDNLQSNPETDLEEEQANQIELQEKLNELVQTRQELRDVQRNLKSDLEFVNQIITILNIAVMPIIVVLVGIFVFRRRRKKRLS